MGRYIDWSVVVGRYPDAAKIAGATDMGSYWLNYAESEIDARLATMYTVPFSPVPDMVKDLCVDLTYYKMSLRQESSKPILDYIEKRIDGILKGTIALVNSGGAVLSSTEEVAYSTQYGSVFGVDDPINWQVPNAALDAAADDRD